jgi:hypothetical protein
MNAISLPIRVPRQFVAWMVLKRDLLRGQILSLLLLDNQDLGP